MKRIYYNLRPVLLAVMAMQYLHFAYVDSQRWMYLPAGLLFVCAVADFIMWRFDGEARNPKKNT